MLDFYLIKDEQRKPDYPEQENLEFAGGIDYETYENLVKKGIIDSRFDYYSDFRWDCKIIEQLTTRNDVDSDSDFKKLNKILRKATETNNGLIAYCD